MSTRSGKRLHNPSNEDIGQTETEVVLKGKRKARGKRVVEDGDCHEVVLKSNNRQNYVSFPADEEVPIFNNLENETQGVPARKLRRNTLKEQNAAPEEVELVNNVKKQGRQTRRTKKLSETVPEATPELPSQEEAIEVVKITNGKQKKKNKKSKKKSKKALESAESTDKENVVNDIKKKKRKKKSQGNKEEQVEEVNDKRYNDSNLSMDSFHSAAGSPICVHSNLIPLRDKGSRDVADAPTLSTYDGDGDSKKKKKSSLKNKSYEINSSMKETKDADVGTANVTFGKDDETDKVGRRRSSLRNIVMDKDKTHTPAKLNATFEKESTVEITSNKKRRKSEIVSSASDKTDVPLTGTLNGILNTTFEKDDIEDIDSKKLRKSNNKSINEVFSADTSETTNIRRSSPRKSLVIPEIPVSLNGTFDISQTADQSKPKSLDTTFDKESKLDSTFDKTDTQQLKSDSKSSLISSDATESTINVTLDKSEEISKISITDDDSKIENILNTTPLLVESSMDESKLETSKIKTPETTKTVITPMKREGTFTKDEPEVVSPKQTPNNRLTLPAAGCTPYHSNGKGSQKKKSVLNLTHSIEKGCRSSLAEVVPRATRVMFCSPVNNPVVVMQQKTKVIKSNLKGSNKSFVYEERDSPCARVSRKRSFTHTEGEASTAKRSRLERPPGRPAERPARARTASAMAKLSATPQKEATPAKPKSDVKATKLPNFAALHARRFERMESLDECQERRAARARLLLDPTGSLAVLQRSPRVTLEPLKPATLLKSATPLKPATPLKHTTSLKSALPLKSATSLKTATPFKPVTKLPTLPTLETLQRGYTRFGFKLNCDVNPFSIPSKTEKKAKEIQPKVVKKVQPSLAGATSLRRAVAKQTIMREKSFTSTGKRDENRKEFRTVIKGVRTNRRFELQMKSRNINV